MPYKVVRLFKLVHVMISGRVNRTTVLSSENQVLFYIVLSLAR